MSLSPRKRLVLAAIGATCGALAAQSVLPGCSAITDFRGLAGDGANDASSDAPVQGDGSVADGSVAVDGAEDAGRPPPTSCQDGGRGASATCGATKADDCCAIGAVPGGTYNRSDDSAYPATVSSFLLDRNLVTVGRMRKFVNAGFGTAVSPPAAGAGAHPKIPASGWASAWKAKLPATIDALKQSLACGNGRWSDTPGDYESFPADCFSWYVAFAFCAWDGGRLPTEAEWNYAASGGSEQRKYAWSVPPGSATIDPTYATYGCFGHGGMPTYNEAGSPNCVAADILAVGVHSPQGDGKWGHTDIAGLMWEWTLDAYQSPYAAGPCVDCANIAWVSGSYRSIRGGDYDTSASSLVTAERNDDSPTTTADDRGLRCARDP